jgi:HEAT repeat protein
MDPSGEVSADTLGAALAEAGDRELLPAMVDLLKDVKNFDTLHNLTHSIVEAGGREGVDSLLSLIEKGELPGHKLHPLCQSIAESGSPEDADRLFDLVQSASHPEEARALLKAATALSGRDGFDHSLELLQSAEEGDVRAAAADIVGRFEAEEHLPQLLEVLGREEFGRAQWHITRAIAQAGEEGLNQLTEFLSRDQNEPRKQEVLSSLFHEEDVDATSVFARTILSDPSPRIREQSAEFLSRIGSEEAVTALTQALQRETDAEVRQRMAKLLGKAREKRE